MTLDTDTKVQVINNLTSSSTTAALSANQGRILHNLINSVGGAKFEIKTASTSSSTRPVTFATFSFSPDAVLLSCYDSSYAGLRYWCGGQTNHIQGATILFAQGDSVLLNDPSGGNRTFTLSNTTITTSWSSSGLMFKCIVMAIKF